MPSPPRLLVVVCALLCAPACLQSTVNTGRARAVSLDDTSPFSAPIFVAPVFDDRRDPRRVGAIKNALNMVLRDVEPSDDDVAGFVRESLVETLRGAGAQILGEERADGVVVQMSLVEFFTEGAPGGLGVECAAKVVVDVEVRLLDGSKWQRRFGFVSEGTGGSGDLDVYEVRLFEALDETLARIVDGLRVLLSRQGQGGAR